MFKYPYYKQLETISVHKEPERNYYVPYQSLEEALTSKKRDESQRFMLLDGQWQFAYYESIHHVPSRFFEQPLLDNSSSYIQVPGTFQNQGYDQHQYVNVSYPIPYDPPYTPYDNPCGIYQREFSLEKQGDQSYYLNFEGVDSNLHVFINGQFVGYDQVTHSPSEFNVTPYLVTGVNRLTVLVMKWCDGTYFEDQDKFRTTGIIRSVYLLTRPQKHLWEYQITPKIDLENKIAQLEVTTKNWLESVSYYLYNPNHQLMAQGVFQKDTQITVENASLWSAETPTLYTLVLETNGEYFKEAIGFRQVEVVGREIYLNGQPITFLGVNHHDTHPDTGSVMTEEMYRMDMLKMKQLNMNAIRTAHYPKPPIFYELADELGFYIVSEADLECHGVVNLYGDLAQYNLMANDSRFEQAMIDRIYRSVKWFINRSSILIWSMGNESGYGKNFEKAQHLIKQLDPSRLIHNERAAEPVSYQANDFSNLDVISRMYPSFNEVTHFCESPQYTKPFMLCEYSHAMGNGPGDLKTYFDLMERYPAFVGGFVWEWADHSMKCVNETGDSYLGYGGDFGETLHDGNFCVDGLTTPYRQWTSKMEEYRNIHLPIQLKELNVNTGECWLKNINSFLVGENYQVVYSWHKNGKKVETGSLDVSHIAPRTKKSVQVKVPTITKQDTLTFEIGVYKKATGEYLGTQQKIIQEVVEHPWKNELSHLASYPLDYVVKDNQFIIIEGKDFMYRFNQQTGLMDQVQVQGEKLLAEPSYLHIWRAPTDNDRNIRKDWQGAGYDQASLNLIDCHIKKTDQGIILTGIYHLGAPGIQRILGIELQMTIDGTGQIAYQFKVKKTENLPDLPRFGIVLPLVNQFNEANYFGFGPFASYEDKHYASQLGEYRQEIAELEERYLYPQENGNRWHTHWVEVIGDSHQIRCTSPRWFNFSLQKYSAKMLTQAKHLDELQDLGIRYLHLDMKQNGIGSNSCGPYVAEASCFSEESFIFEGSLFFNKKN